jgi:hypothetical protein
MGFAIPLVAVALIQLVVGTTVYIRSPKDIEKVNAILKNEPATMKSEEQTRMQVVMKNFVIYRNIEIALIIFGGILLFFAQAESIWKGVGLGLVIQASLMLGLDYFAEQRGKVYSQYVASEVSKNSN